MAIIGQTSISRYASMAAMSPGLMEFERTAFPPASTSTSVERPERKPMKGKKNPNSAASDMEARR